MRAAIAVAAEAIEGLTGRGASLPLKAPGIVHGARLRRSALSSGNGDERMAIHADRPHSTLMLYTISAARLDRRVERRRFFGQDRGISGMAEDARGDRRAAQWRMTGFAPVGEKGMLRRQCPRPDGLGPTGDGTGAGATDGAYCQPTRDNPAGGKNAIQKGAPDHGSYRRS